MDQLSRDLAPAIDAGQAQLLGAERSFFQNSPLFGSKLSRILSACTLTLPEMGLKHLKEGLQSGYLKNRVGHIIYGALCFLPLFSGIAWIIWALSPRHERPSGDQAREAASTEVDLGDVAMGITGQSPLHERPSGDQAREAASTEVDVSDVDMESAGQWPQHEGFSGDQLLYTTEVAVGDGRLSPAEGDLGDVDEDVASETSSIKSAEADLEDFVDEYRLATVRDEDPWSAPDATRRHFNPRAIFTLPTGTISIVYDKEYLAIGANAIVSPDNKHMKARSGAAKPVHDGARDNQSDDNSPFLRELRAHLEAADGGVLPTGAALFHRVEASSPLAKRGTGFVIHAVGPTKFDASDKKIALLKTTYEEAFFAAMAANCARPNYEKGDPFSVAVCLISAGRFAAKTGENKKIREASFLTCLQVAKRALGADGELKDIRIHLYEHEVDQEECQALCGLAKQELDIDP